MIKVLFFAQTRELIGIDSVELDGPFETVESIRAHLVEEGTKKDGKWDLALESGKLLAAVNQSIVPLDTQVKAGDEVAFFPPVTGGVKMDSRVSVQIEDFSVEQEYQRLSEGTAAGAVVTFVGKVRDMNLGGDNVIGLHLEHYPGGMTEKSLSDICDQAESRWPLLGVRVIHRVGDMDSGDQIVFVGRF